MKKHQKLLVPSKNKITCSKSIKERVSIQVDIVKKGVEITNDINTLRRFFWKFYCNSLFCNSLNLFKLMKYL